MGYDSTILIVDKKDNVENKRDGKVFGDCIARFDLRCMEPTFIDFVEKYPDTNCYCYEIDGNTRIVEDAYKRPLTEIPLRKLLSYLRSSKEGKMYRRTSPVIAYLNKIIRDSSFNNLVALHYGS
jgi:hypothetical protein